MHWYGQSVKVKILLSQLTPNHCLGGLIKLQIGGKSLKRKAV